MDLLFVTDSIDTGENKNESGVIHYSVTHFTCSVEKGFSGQNEC